MSEKLYLQDDQLQAAASLLKDAASTQNIGRSFPTVNTYTSVETTILAFFQAVVIACEALSDAAHIASLDATSIATEVSHTDDVLAKSADR